MMGTTLMGNDRNLETCVDNHGAKEENERVIIFDHHITADRNHAHGSMNEALSRKYLNSEFQRGNSDIRKRGRIPRHYLQARSYRMRKWGDAHTTPV